MSSYITGDMQDTLGINKMSPKLKDMFIKKLFQSIPVQMNGSFGASSLAAVSVYTVSETFVSNESKENLYYIYVFENGYPVIVDFTMGEDQSVYATGHYIMAKDFEDSVDGIHALMNDPVNIECNIELVQ